MKSSPLLLVCASLAPLALLLSASCSSSSKATSDDAGAGEAGEAAASSDTGPGVDANEAGAAPQSVDLDLSGTCPAFTPCGGDITGTWNYTGACLSDAFAEAKQQCPGLTATNAKGTLIGTITATATTLTRNVTVNAEASLTFPSSCLTDFGGDCSLLQAGINAKYKGKTTCTAGASGSCTCDFNGDISPSSQPDTYTVSGTQITTGSGDTYDFCVMGDQLEERKTAGSIPEPGIYTLKRQ